MDRVLPSLVTDLLKQLGSFTLQELQLLVGVDDELQNLQYNFKMVQAMLNKAEERRLRDEAVKLWYDKLEDAYYMMDDVLDTRNTAKIKLQIQNEEEGEKAAAPLEKKMKKYAEELLFQEALMCSIYSSEVFDEKEDVILPVSDEKYAEVWQFQEYLMGSVITSKLANNEALTLLPLLSSPTPTIQAILPTSEPEPAKEAGESSYSFCEICVERKDSDQMFKTESCVHSFCSDCIGKHVATKIQESITTVTCPGLDCKSVIELDACREVLPKDVLDRWDEALCEALFGSQRFYCPFKDCSAMLLNDNEEGEAIRESECPFCHRLFCAVCYVPWHSGVDCEEFQRLNEDERGRDDLMLRELVKEKKWRRCPHCKYFVERTDGCLHMTCRCTSQFCYGCGAEWTSDHGGCQRD